MTKLIQENKLYFGLFVTYIVAATIILNRITLGDELIELSKHNTLFWDSFFTHWTKVAEAYIYILAFLVCLFYRFGHALLFILLGAAVSLSSFFSKIFFSLERPYSYFNSLGIEAKLHVVDMNEINLGNSSFPSGHTISAFAIMSLFAFLSKDKFKLAILFFILALSSGFSRMYLSQHFLRDVVAGSLIGVYLAALSYTIFMSEQKKAKAWCSKNLKFGI